MYLDPLVALISLTLALTTQHRFHFQFSNLPILHSTHVTAVCLLNAGTRIAYAQSYSNVDHEALKRRQLRQQQERLRQQQQQQREQQERKQQQQQRQGQFHHNPFGHGGAGGDGFQNIFEHLFGGGGGGRGGGFQFAFDGHGFPFGHHQQRTHAHGDESSDPKYIRKALKSFKLDETVDLPELKRTYRRLAVKYHPDKCQGPDCEAKMVKVNQYRDAIEKWIKSNQH